MDDVLALERLYGVSLGCTEASLSTVGMFVIGWMDGLVDGLGRARLYGVSLGCTEASVSMFVIRWTD